MRLRRCTFCRSTSRIFSSLSILDKVVDVVRPLWFVPADLPDTLMAAGSEHNTEDFQKLEVVKFSGAVTWWLDNSEYLSQTNNWKHFVRRPAPPFGYGASV